MRCKCMTRVRTLLALTILIVVVRAADARSQGWMWCNASSIVAPGRPVIVRCYENPQAAKAIARLFRISLEQAIAAQTKGVSDETLPLAGVKPVASSPLKPSTIANQVQALMGRVPIGLYALQVTAPGQTRFERVVSVSTIGVLGIRADAAAVEAPVDLRTDRIASDVQMFSVQDDLRVTLAPSADGLFSLVSSADGRPWFAFARAADGSVAFDSWNYYQQQSEPRIFVQTDRPVYRPGDVIHIRAVLRSGPVGAYRIERTPVQFDILQQFPARPIARRTLTPDAFGSISTDVRLPDDASLGTYQIDVAGWNAGYIVVEAYRKPEYVIDVAPKEHFPLAGTTVHFSVHVTYLFGAPAGGMTLHYSGAIQNGLQPWYGPFQQLIRWPNPQVSEPLQGDLTTDSGGNAVIAVRTKSLPYQAVIHLTVDARDESGRTVSVESNAIVVPATFQIAVIPDRWFGAVGTLEKFAVKTKGYDGSARPNLAVHVDVIETTYQDGKSSDVDRGSVNVTTDGSGSAAFGWTPPHVGAYRFDASATDEHGDRVIASQYQWVPDPKALWGPPLAQPVLIVQKSQFASGETAHLLLALKQPDRDAVIALSTDHLVETRVVHVHGLTADIALQPPEGVQFVNAQAFVPEENGLDVASAQVAIDPGPTTLNVNVRASKASYQPGDRARMRIHVTDDRGNPVSAEIGIGVVDQGIYAIAPDRSDPRAAFFDRTANVFAYPDWYVPNLLRPMLKTIANVSSAAVGTVDMYSVNAANEQGVPSGTAAVPAPTMPPMTVRSNFLDTAYWAPAVTTDARGNATVAFDWPDDLTTWVSTAVAFSKSTQIGNTTAKSLVTKDFLVRLETPRFLRAGDHSTIVGIAHGKRGTSVRMQLEETAGDTPAQRSAIIDQNLRASAAWPLVAPGVGSTLLTLRGTDGDLTDAMQQTLPLLGATQAEHVRDAGIAAASVTVPTDLGSGELAGSLELSFSPSIVAEVAQTLREFNVYPYYCTEQTGSNGLVAAALLSAASQIRGIELKGDPKAVIARARARLDELEHTDGGWGWWTTDRSNVFMTAYAVWTLQAMQQAQPDPREDMRIARGVAWLERGLNANGEVSDEEHALALFAIGNAQPQQIPSGALDAVFAGIDRASATTTAFAGLAARAAGRNDLVERAVAHLRATALSAGGASFWRDGDWGYEWWTDPVAATSYAAMLFGRAHDASDLQSSLEFIRDERQGDWWYTTTDTAAAATALAQIESRAGTSSTNEIVRVKIGNDVVRTVRITNAVPDASDTHVVIPAALMQEHEPVTIERSGPGMLYWSSDFTRYMNRNATTRRDAKQSVLRRLFAAPPALSVDRRYTVDHPGPWKIGDRVTVDLWITARDGARYVTLEDPFPAGVEYQPLQGQGESSWSGAQFLDDRAAFFLYWLFPNQTVHLQYQLRATTAGTYAAPGPSAYASYGPPIAAVGTGEDVVIR